MNVDAFRVQQYRSLEDTGWVDIDDLTCLVGKNESGKTAFLRAIEKLNPAYDDEGYSAYEEYPREDWPEYSDRHDEDPAVVASGRFHLEDEDVAAVESAFVEDILTDHEVTVHRDYQNERHWELELEESAVLTHLREARDFDSGVRDALDEAETLSDLEAEARAAVESTVGSDPVAVVAEEVGDSVLAERLPGFRFVGEYSVMNGTIDINAMLERQETGDLDAGDQVFLSLLSVAGLELSDLQDVEDWRKTTTELEGASTRVSEEAMAYWSQSGDIRVRIQRAGSDDQPLIDIRLENRDHNVTVEFEQRSHGFRRFFSTFCQLSEMRHSDEELVLLLDEPGLNLHARAKQEFLEFLKTEIAARHRTLYTAHSPFLIDKQTVHRTRLVLADPVGEENIVSDVSKADEYTRFPLRNVFEVDLMDTLLVYPQTLLVERKADHVFLYVLSQLLRDDGRSGLDDRWTVVPVKNARNVGTFASLFGEEQLDVAVLLNERPDWTVADPGRGAVEEHELSDVPMTLASEYSSSGGDGTIEDVLSESFYLDLVNGAYATELGAADRVPDQLTAAELDGDGPVVSRLERYFETNDINGGEFDRDEPALYLQHNRGELSGELDKETRRNFTRLFTDLNNTLESFEGVQDRETSFLGSLFG